MAINKIVLNTESGEQVLVDLTGDNVTADKMLQGATAHDKSGENISGTIESFDGSYECSGESTGGGTAQYKTCTIKLINEVQGDEMPTNGSYTVTQVINGEIQISYSEKNDDEWGYVFPQELVLENVLCGSFFNLAVNCEGGWVLPPENVVELDDNYGYNWTTPNEDGAVCVFRCVSHE